MFEETIYEKERLDVVLSALDTLGMLYTVEKREKLDFAGFVSQYWIVESVDPAEPE